jgi:predicted glycoside hydrolase/deacetylase ChbG (UPF0249 family)
VCHPGFVENAAANVDPFSSSNARQIEMQTYCKDSGIIDDLKKLNIELYYD